MNGRELLSAAVAEWGGGWIEGGGGNRYDGYYDTPSGAELIRRADAEPRLRAALEFLWRRLRRLNDGPGMYLIEHVLYCGCDDDQHFWDRSVARGDLADRAAAARAALTTPGSPG